MNDEYIVGGSVVSWCGKCKLELDHTIETLVDKSPKKVKCNTCKALHNFRSKPGEKTKKEKTPRKTKAQKEDYSKYIAILEGVDPSDAEKYSMKGNFKEDGVINHSKYGIGIVTSVINNNKIKVFFKDDFKLFVQNQ